MKARAGQGIVMEREEQRQEVNWTREKAGVKNWSRNNEEWGGMKVGRKGKE